MDINAFFSQGQAISLIGPNASGKTTLIKCILGLVHPDQGSIYVDSVPIAADPSYRNNIGYMPQIGRYPDNIKIGQLFSMLKELRQINEQRLDYELYEEYNLSSLLDHRMHTLSGGTRQKVSAALAFLFNPTILILDEPTAGLDPLSSELLKNKIVAEKKKNKLILMTSHILSDMEDLCTHVMYLQDGKIIFYKELAELQTETHEIKLNNAIVKIMKNSKLLASYN